MYNSEGRLSQSGDGEASLNVNIYKCLVLLVFMFKQSWEML
jgi:hypothetical protein